jgi:hypothetical protein
MGGPLSEVYTISKMLDSCQLSNSEFRKLEEEKGHGSKEVEKNAQGVDLS